jgi:hypothetical protein
MTAHTIEPGGFTMRFAPILAVLALAVAGCSSAAAKPDPASPTVADTSAAAPAAAPKPTTAHAKDASAVVAALKAAGLPIGDVIVYTASTDSNHLLGRPGGYVSKASFADTRITAADARDDSPGSVDLGGSVEVFSNASEAKARAAYIHTAQAAVQILGTEYDYTAGPVLLRVSQVLTPDQAAAYQKALN